MSTQPTVTIDPFGTGPLTGTEIGSRSRRDSPHPRVRVDVDGTTFVVEREQIKHDGDAE